LIVALGLESTTSNARRVIEGGGLNIGKDKTAIRDPNALIDVEDGLIVRVGKRRIVRVRLSS
jgi:tyrosyl-tRNA synthetase